MEQLDIQASNIKCAGCVSNIENGLTNMAGINNVNVNIETNIVTIEGNNLEQALIELKLSELGYPAKK